MGVLARVAQRPIVLGERGRQLSDVGFAALELVAELGHARGEIGGCGLGGGRPGPLGHERALGLTELLLLGGLLEFEHANAAGLERRGNRLGGGRLGGGRLGGGRVAPGGSAPGGSTPGGSAAAGSGAAGSGAPGSDGSGTSTAPSWSHARTSEARAIAAGARKLIRHVPGIIPVSPGGSGIAGNRRRSPWDSTTSHGCPGEVGRRRQRPLIRTVTRSPASSSHSTASIPRAATTPGSVIGATVRSVADRRRPQACG